MANSTWRTASWVFGIATALTLFSVMMASQLPTRPGLWRLVQLNGFYWYLWAAFAFPIIAMARRFRLERRTWRRSLPVHVAGVIVFSSAHSVAVTLVQYSLRASEWTTPLGAVVRQMLVRNFDWEMMTYWAIVGVTLAAQYRQEAYEREVSAAQLQTRLVESQLQNLQQRLHPHFLFNTLHAISTLMHRDVEEADRMLTLLSDLLRLSLRHPEAVVVPLKEELEFLQKYVEIECTRFRDRLTVRYDVQPEALDALVPNLILQPIVENAVRHGIAPRIAPGHVDVIARREGANRLLMEVRDDGVGLSQDAVTALQKGIGLSTTRARLQHQYGAAHQFEFQRRPAGLTVRIVIPWRTEEPAPADAHATIPGDERRTA